MRTSGSISCTYVDCKSPQVRKLPSGKLLSQLSDQILGSTGRKVTTLKELPPYERLERIIKDTAANKKHCLIFDEIEYITPFSPIDTHWRTEFIDFWQTLWSLQSTHGRLCFVICGVNPQIVEIDTLAGVQNPLFGIVPSTYLRGLDVKDMGRMLNFFGNRMGLQFSDDACVRLHKEYGGHPLLTRKACSFIHAKLSNEKVERPFRIDAKYFEENAKAINADIEFYFKHVLSELERFYLDEYSMLTYAVSGQEVDFAELAKEPQLTRHLTQYGLLRLTPSNKPVFLIESVKGYLARETARREGRRHAFKMVEGAARQEWLRARLTSLAKDFRHLNSAFLLHSKMPLFTTDTLAKPEDFVQAPAAATLEGFKAFLVTANMLIIEDIEAAAKKGKRKDFFFGYLRNGMPSLFDALHRIRVYRNAFSHGKLLPEVKKNRDEYLMRDLGCVKDSFSVAEVMILQQIILDELFFAVQDELSKLAN